ncbi:kinase-like domain-containing protein [Rhizophagus irregularis DAOM 181602=DAOM 197198]|nr:kinase-like domain-containing protein [Rhizophagus irregularis DAOM 181602=DAOM 197198]
MELTKILNYDSFDPTPKLKSSPVPISFVSFNRDDPNCIHCGDKYVRTACKQYYCKKCLSYYLANITDNNLYLDVSVLTENLECGEHKISMTKEPQNIQECCRNCLGIFCFKQLLNNFVHFSSDNLYYNSLKNVIESEKNCRLCGKSLYQEIYNINHDYYYYDIKLCSDCYLISSECIESTLTKKPITILYLPCSGNSDLDDFLDNSRLKIHNRLRLAEFTDKIKNIGNYFIPNELFSSIYISEISMEWIPYSQFTNVEEIARGGFGIIYLATWLDGPIKGDINRKRNSNETIILKKFKNSEDVSKYFLNELKSNQSCYEFKHHIIRTYGFTRDPEFDDYILVMQYASGGDLHNWIQQNFTKITWNKRKLAILWQISEGLETIHNADYIHRDFHSGNILFDLILDGERPEITEDTPECFANLMKRCWDSDPEKRPSITEVRKTLSIWYHTNRNIEPFNQAEIKRKELMNLKKLGPEFSGKPHPSAIYTSRPLSSFISKCSSNSNSSKNYISRELEFDLDFRTSTLGTKRKIEEININSHENRKSIKISSSYSRTFLTDRK